MRVIVLGGYGNFGARICRALSEEAGFEVIAAGRRAGTAGARGDSGVRGARLDLSAADFAQALRALSPDLVVHCAGPFQGQDYRVASAAMAAGAHYLDLSDAREFVARFAECNDATARTADRIALSGASTLPALSSAVIEGLAGRLHTLDEIRIAIAPAQRAPRGEATVAAGLGYAGRRFRWWSAGAWRDAWGWQELRRVRFAFGTRWGAACDVPDLELFPARYPGVRTVEFRAALELGAQHAALWVLAALRRAGVTPPVERWTRSLNRLASLMDGLGSERGGMLVEVTGVRADGRKARIEWHLTADANHGPETPCMAAILLARKLSRGGIPERGAFPCMGFLTLAEFEGEFERWGMSTVIDERDA